MSRVSKAFRSMLLDRATARAIWRNALARVPGLPPPPKSMSEPRLVYLIYGTNCQASAMRVLSFLPLTRHAVLRDQPQGRCMLQRSHAPLSQMRENAVSTIVEIAIHLPLTRSGQIRGIRGPPDVPHPQKLLSYRQPRHDEIHSLHTEN